MQARDSAVCSRCRVVERPSHGGRYCLGCSAAYMRAWRASRPMTDEQKRKDRCRSYAGVYLRRGKLQKQPCQNCGSEDSEMHHPDYSKPLEVEWLCRECHLDWHWANHKKAA